jgi:hypothetical protein
LLHPAVWELESSLLEHLPAGDNPTSKAIPWPLQKPVKDFGNCLTSKVRPLLRSATALNVCTTASGFIPASAHDNGSSNLRLAAGEREGPDCVSSCFSEVFFAFTRDLCVFFLSYGVLCNTVM